MHPHHEKFGIRVSGWWRPTSTRMSRGRRLIRKVRYGLAAGALSLGLWRGPPLIGGASDVVPYIAASSADATGTADATGVTVTIPACAVGDTLVVHTAISAFNAGPYATVTIPTGWTSVGTAVGTGAVQRAGSHIDIRVADSGDTPGTKTYTWTANVGATTPFLAKAYVIKGGRSGSVVTTYVLDGTVTANWVVGSNGTDATAECSALTTGYANTLVMLASALAQSGVALTVRTATPPSGFTEQGDFGANNGANTVSTSLTTDTAVQSAAGTTGTNTITWSGTPTTGSWAALTVIFAAPQPVRSVLLTTGSSGTDASSYNTASVTIPAGVLTTIAILNQKSPSATAVNSVTSTGATWVQGDTAGANGTASRNVTRASIWRTVTSADQTGAITIDFNANTQARCSWEVVAHYGAESSGASGANGIPQMATNTGASGNPSKTMAAFKASYNATYAWAGIEVAGTTFTPGTGFYELTDAAMPESGASYSSNWIDKENDSVILTPASSNGQWVLVAAEIRAQQRTFPGGIAGENEPFVGEQTMAGIVT